MFISTSTTGFCPSKVLHARSFTSSVSSTASSFKSWDSCMNNKACKIIAIVGIVLAGIVLIWVIGGLARCLCYGVSGILEMFCCCCCCNRRSPYQSREMSTKQEALENPFMYHHATVNNQGYTRTVHNPSYGTPVNTMHYGVVSDEANGNSRYSHGVRY